jgi:hypothetical protein
MHLAAAVTTAIISAIARARWISVEVCAGRALEGVSRLATMSVTFLDVGTRYKRAAGAAVLRIRRVVVVGGLALEGSSRVELVDSLEVAVQDEKVFSDSSMRAAIFSHLPFTESVRA